MAEETTKRKSERRSKATANILEEQGQKHHKGENPTAKLRQSNKHERKEDTTRDARSKRQRSKKGLNLTSPA